MANKRSVAFLLWPSLPYGNRVILVSGLLLFGILVQILLVWWAGSPAVLFGAALLIPKGMTNKEKVPSGANRKWEKVTDEELKRCLKQLKASKDWASEANLGCFSTMLMIVLLLAGGYCLIQVPPLPAQEAEQLFKGFLPSSSMLRAIGFDAVVIAISLLAGRVSGWTPQDMEIHLSAINNIVNFLQQSSERELVLEPMLEIAKVREKQVPCDARLMIKFKSAPESFMGIQVQVSTNVVQSSRYPYLYCVLLARPEFSLLEKTQPLLGPPPRPKAADRKNKDKNFQTFGKCVVELESSGEVDVVVVRQLTFGSGYHTRPGQQIAVVQSALDLAEKIL